MNVNKAARNKKLKDFSYELVLPAKKLTDGVQSTKSSVVFLIGWTGCKDRYLSKYSAFYETKDFVVLRYSPSAKLMFGFDPEKVLTLHASRLIEILKENQVEKNPIYFHFFSNGGAVMYYLICKQLEKMENGFIKLRGCIFDSSPALMTNKTTLQAIASVVPGSSVKKYSVGAAAICFLWFSYSLNKFRDLFTGNPTEAYRLWVWYSLLKQANLSPQLFLYSKGDKIADFKSIETFISERDKIGVKTDSNAWQDSNHVSHFKTYPEEYTRKIEEFLRFCQQNENSEPVLGKFGTEARMERAGFQDEEDADVPLMQ